MIRRSTLLRTGRDSFFGRCRLVAKADFQSDDKRFRAVLVKPADVPTYVEYGAADIGIAGRDVIMESRADVLQPLDLNFGHCKIAVAGPENALRIHLVRHPTVRVATKYPRITLDYYNARGIPVEIIPLSGSIELAPLIGLADRIVDLVETGRTLKENGLEMLESHCGKLRAAFDQPRRLSDQTRRSACADSSSGEGTVMRIVDFTARIGLDVKSMHFLQPDDADKDVDKACRGNSSTTSGTGVTRRSVTTRNVSMSSISHRN